MISISQIERKITKLQASANLLKKDIDSLNRAITHNDKELEVVEEAKNVVKIVAKETQQQLTYHISSIVSNAMAAVFDDPYSLSVNFEERRGKTECDILFERNDETTDPVESSGYGVVDIAAFALRLASWNMAKKYSPVLILDEPFKHLKGIEANRRAIMMMKEVSNEIGVQIITVSDERAPREDIAAGADKLFLVSISNSESKIKEI